MRPQPLIAVTDVEASSPTATACYSGLNSTTSTLLSPEPQK